jgi:UDP-glucose 4-epimerase
MCRARGETVKALVTGSAGFLGRHIATRLRDEGWEVTAFDLEPTNIDGVQSIIGDLRDAGAVTSAATGHEVVCHVGAIGDVYLAGEQPALAAGVNVVGSANVASAAEQAGARVVYASTWEVYGEPLYEPLDEKHPTAPDHPYNITKLGGEQLLMAADRLRGLPVLSLRLGTAYGRGLRPNSVFRIFIDRARRHEPITILGDGSQGRQFTHTGDIAEAFVLACAADVHGMTLNVVSPRSVSIRELAELVTARYPTRLTFGDPRPGDVPSAIVSASKIADVLGWKAATRFEDGLDDLMDAIEADE